MSYGERHTLGYLVTATLIPTAYCLYVLVRLAGTSVGEFGFQAPLLTAVGISIVLNVFIAPAPRPGGRDRRDERDTEIARLGDRVGFVVLGAAAALPFALALVEADHFWIANALYFAYVLSAIVSSAWKLRLYRQGM